MTVVFGVRTFSVIVIFLICNHEAHSFFCTQLCQEPVHKL
uniref:Uncharacterized protein n=1 Tax=Siphoviridae sp. ctXmm2 TaxID=2825546 RepID=A0A8S5QIU0_9CAUD|nr:MAG TPA: hypothetical protein [Siphoviridae sp. ctXmm2]